MAAPASPCSRTSRPLESTADHPCSLASRPCAEPSGGPAVRALPLSGRRDSVATAWGILRADSRRRRGGLSRADRDPRDLQPDAGQRQERRVRLPRDQLHELGDAQRRAARLRRGRERRHHPGLHRRRGVRRPAPGVKDMVTGAVGARRVRPRRRREVPGQHRAAHRPLPEGQARQLRPPADRDQPRAGRPRREPAVPVAHVGRLGRRAATRTSTIAAELLEQAAKARIILEIEIGVVGGEEDGVAHEINEKLYTAPGDYEADGRGAGCRREGPLPAGRDVRQRARRLQAGQRQAAPGGPQAGPGGRPRASSACPAGSKPFDLVFHGGSGLAARGDPRGDSATAW